MYLGQGFDLRVRERWTQRRPRFHRVHCKRVKLYLGLCSHRKLSTGERIEVLYAEVRRLDSVPR